MQFVKEAYELYRTEDNDASPKYAEFKRKQGETPPFKLVAYSTQLGRLAFLVTASLHSCVTVSTTFISQRLDLKLKMQFICFLSTKIVKVGKDDKNALVLLGTLRTTFVERTSLRNISICLIIQLFSVFKCLNRQ